MSKKAVSFHLTFLCSGRVHLINFRKEIRLHQRTPSSPCFHFILEIAYNSFTFLFFKLKMGNALFRVLHIVHSTFAIFHFSCRAKDWYHKLRTAVKVNLTPGRHFLLKDETLHYSSAFTLLT